MTYIERRNEMNVIRKPNRLLSKITLFHLGVLVMIGSTCLQAQSREDLELSAAELFNRSFSGMVTFDSREEGLPELQQGGCPTSTSLDGVAGKEVELKLTTGAPGQWVGDIDGINTEGTVESLNEDLSVVITPTNLPSVKAATKRGLLDDSVVEYRTIRLFTVSRPELDAASERYSDALNACLALLPKKSSFTPAELQVQCPNVGITLPPLPTKSEVGQTCLEEISIFLEPSLESAETFEATYFVDQLCDFVGFPVNGISEETNVSFSSCFSDTYKGQVVFDAEQTTSTRSIKKRMRRGATQQCRRSIAKKAKNRAQKIRRCKKRLARRNGF